MARARRDREIIRQFPENGLKLLLENGANVRDLLELAGPPERQLIDFDGLTKERTTFVSRDFRHVEADVVLRAPVLRSLLSDAHQAVWIYLLIEHQTEPDEWLILRLLDYQIQIYKAQLREWKRRHGTVVGFRLQPVVPLVLYTGTRDWEELTQLWELMMLGEAFKDRTPTWKPIFLNIGNVSRKRLESAGGAFGEVLRVLQQRGARPEVFEPLFRHAVEQLQTRLSPAEVDRLLELFSYLVALVYNERAPAESAALQTVLENAVQSDRLRREVQTMGITAAQALREEGRKEEAIRTRQAILILLLEQFKEKLPAKVREAVESCQSVEQLDGWLRRVRAAKRIKDIGISATKEEGA